MRSFSPAQDEDGRQEYVDDIRGMIRALAIILPLLHGFHLMRGWGQFSTKQVTDMIPTGFFLGGIPQGGGLERVGGKLTPPLFFSCLIPVKGWDLGIWRVFLGGGDLGPAPGLGGSFVSPEHSACKNTYGYKKFATSDGLTSGFARLMEDTIVPSVKKGYSAAIYTQLSDIEEEVNGLITYDRKKVKMNPLIVQKWNAHGLRKR